MAGQGIQIWDASGNLTFDSSVYTARIAGVQGFSSDTGSTIIPFTPGAGRVLWWYVVMAGDAFVSVADVTTTDIEVVISGLTSGEYVNVFYGDRVP